MSRLGGSCSPNSTELGQHRPSPFTIDAILSEDIGPRKLASSPVVENPPSRPPWAPLNDPAALLRTPPAKNSTTAQRECNLDIDIECLCLRTCVNVRVCVYVCSVLLAYECVCVRMRQSIGWSINVHRDWNVSRWHVLFIVSCCTSSGGVSCYLRVALPTSPPTSAESQPTAPPPYQYTPNRLAHTTPSYITSSPLNASFILNQSNNGLLPTADSICLDDSNLGILSTVACYYGELSSSGSLTEKVEALTVHSTSGGLDVVMLNVCALVVWVCACFKC